MSEPRLAAANPAATAAADPPLDPPGTRVVSCGLRVGSERRILRARPHGEFVEVGLADHDGAGLAELRDDRRVVRGTPSVEDLRRARRRDAARAHVVLERDRHPGERPRITTDRHGVVDLRGPGASLVREHEVEGVDVALPLVDHCQVPLEDVGRAGEVVSDVPGDVGNAGRELVAHAQSSNPTIGGTRNRPSSAAGAAASTSSRSRQSISMSSRITLAIGVGCVMGSTPSRSRASMSAK